MRIHQLIFLLAAVGSLALISCDKDKPVLDKEGPEVNILAPADQSTFETGDQMGLQVEIKENLGLHGYFIWLIESETGWPHLIDKQHSHGENHDLNINYRLPDIPEGKYEIFVEATDHDGNIGEATIEIFIE